uniref:Uncharacterized protein n=1 Tax=Anopheles dirus TaxID=7168 RepID=A0A182NWD1_9DIPT
MTSDAFRSRVPASVRPLNACA